MRGRRWLLALALMGALAAAAVVVVPDYGKTEFVQWRDDTVHGPWRAVYDGHGRNGIRDGVITMRPQPATVPTETHAGLIVSLTTYQNVSLRLRARTVAQLRNVRPNPWESAWVIWHYTDDHHFYYLALKPNGWELGKRDPAYPGGQRFLATGMPKFSLKRWYDIRVDQKGPTMTVRTGDRTLTTFTDTERPYTRGSVGLYTEDAEVEFRNITARD
ncbi:family 16 glycoside hydrolase [Actinomadura fulvescens]|uniref:3-keto-alpha-glucoside-1,2-lyase/3-keto-2-hydroxy-glucal hydratase domain-containing protein n=1 Tax=Actinomadura fulvescens TaxID=46160 RepID=A0ABP6C8X4_9ACTN